METAREAGATEDEESFKQRSKSVAGAGSPKGKEVERPRKRRG
jgi:hypothetical protein